MKTTIDTTFSEALTAMKADHTVRCKRSEWNYDISRHYIEENDFVTEPFLIVAAGDDGYGVWTPTNADLFANDWIIENVRFEGEQMLENFENPTPSIPEGELSGYYWIKGDLTHNGMDARVHFHRGKGLPDLRKVAGIKELLFTYAARQKIKADEKDVYDACDLTNLDDFFTKEEVADIIKDLEPETMDITIGYVLTNSIKVGDTSMSNMGYDGSVKPGNYTLYEPNNSDKYIQTIKWLYDDKIKWGYDENEKLVPFLEVYPL